MKHDLIRQSLVCLLVGLVMFACANVSWATGVEVEVPYAVTSTNWWTGVAIKNLDKSNATGDIKMEFFNSNGELMGAVEIAPLAPLAIYSNVTSNIYVDPLPGSYSLRVFHPDEQELAVTVFVGNSATGGFACQTYNSRVCCQTTGPERFELVMNNEAVLDRNTGLVWQRDTSATKYNWNDALEYCYLLEIGGRKAWRLPTIHELLTLIDLSQSDPALPSGHSFTNAKSSGYWSSTTIPDYKDFADYAGLIYFNDGYAGYSHKTKSYYVRAVRSGQ